MILRTIVFLLINFAALGLGSYFTGPGVSSEWYQSLAKAPWTPPGWVFGAAWTTIMICFAIYMAMAWDKVDNQKVLVGLFAMQWVLNISWNPAFFYAHQMLLALILIITLTLLVGLFLFYYLRTMGWFSGLVLPYFIWLLIASSLNLYILITN